MLSQLNFNTEGSYKDLGFFVQQGLSTIYARELANTRGSVATPCWMEARVHELVKGVPEIRSVKVIKGEELVFERMNLFHAVGKGASSAPRYIAVEYIGNPESKDIEYAIVGKGLTYDTGGLNLKPTNSIEDMYLDKSGACATIGALHGTIALKLKKNIVFVVGLAENSIDANSYKPMDIIKS